MYKSSSNEPMCTNSAKEKIVDMAKPTKQSMIGRREKKKEQVEILQEGRMKGSS